MSYVAYYPFGDRPVAVNPLGERNAMRRCLLLTLSCAGMACMTGPASANAPFYLTGSAGILLPSGGQDQTTSNGTYYGDQVGTNNYNYDSGPYVNLGFGFKLKNGFRVGGELGYADFSTTSVRITNTGTDLDGNRFKAHSSINHYSLTANGFYDLPVDGPVVPYVGAGLGFAVATMSDRTVSTSGCYCSYTYGGTETFAVIQAELGANINFGEHWSIVPAYRYEFMGNFSSSYFGAHIFKVGVSYTF